jgi:hypothetical protein
MNKRTRAAIAGAALTLGAAVVGGSMLIATVAANASSGSDLAGVKAAVARYHTTAAAERADYVLVPGLDNCFELPGTGGMGIHYINTGLLDTTLDPAQPEALVYQQKKDGSLHLGAVEYIVPQAAWDPTHPADASGNRELPVIHGLQPEDMTLHLNAGLQVYVLHAWIFDKNSAGTFEDWNPAVSCLPGT